MTMAKYEKHDTDEGKYQCPVCQYGHGVGNGKSRQSVSRHYNALHAEETPPAPTTPKTKTDAPKRVDVKEDENDDSTPSAPEWLTFDMGEEEGEEPSTVSISPTAASVLKGMAAGADPPSSPKALKDFYEQQGKMMRWVFAGAIDPIVSWYGKSITTNPEFKIKRSRADWELFETVSANWLEYHGVQLPITPNIIMAGTIASMYAPVFVKIQRERDPKKPSLLKRWRARRALRKALKAEKEA
jgi:hypothetical protein